MMQNEKDFRVELQTLVNKYSVEVGSDTPDFLLAEYIVQQLNTWDQYVTRREMWWGRVPTPKTNGGESDGQ